MRCMITARRRARAMMAFPPPRRWATLMAQAGERLDGNGTKEIDPHHLGDAAGIAAVARVHLIVQERFGVMRLDAHDRQARLRQSVEEPLREQTRLKPDPLELPGWILRTAQKI